MERAVQWGGLSLLMSSSQLLCSSQWTEVQKKRKGALWPHLAVGHGPAGGGHKEHATCYVIF